MDKRNAKAGIPIKEYKKAVSKQILLYSKIQQISFKPKPVRLLDVLPGK